MPSFNMSDNSGVPPLFMCPISLCMMEDPVTLPSGITYDRPSVEKWLREGKSTCPVTMSVIGANPNLIPNHMIRGLILDWQSTNQSQAAPPSQPISFRHIMDNIACDATGSHRLASLKRLRFLIESGKPQNSSLIPQEGLVALLDSFLRDQAKYMNHNPSSPDLKTNNNNNNDTSSNPIDEETMESLEEAVSILALLHLNRADLELLSNPQALTTIAWLLRERASIQAATLVERIATECRMGAEAMEVITSPSKGVMGSLFSLLLHHHRGNGSSWGGAGCEAGIRALAALQEDPSTREWVVKAMVEKEERMGVLIELLPKARKKKGYYYSEKILGLLSTLCLSSQAGRAFVRAHPLSLPSVLRTLLLLSDRANELSVTILWCLLCAPSSSSSSSISSSDPNPNPDVGPDAHHALAHEASRLGASQKLLVVAQMDCSTMTKKRIKDLLKELTRFTSPGHSFHNNTSQRRL